MNRLLTVSICAVFLTLLAGCDQEKTSDQQQNQAQEYLNNQAVQEVGLPAITRFSEKRQLKEIYELRDKMIPTVTYVMDMQGRMHKLCDSVGFGIPYSTQYTSPQRVAKYNETQEHGNVTLPQADPNGLYSPSNSDGAWIECINPDTHKPTPLYVEPRVIVSPFPMT